MSDDSDKQTAKDVVDKLQSMGLVVDDGTTQSSLEDVVDEKSKHQESIELMRAMYGRTALEHTTKDVDQHKFWSTQPVPKKDADEDEFKIGPLDEPKTVADVRPEPYNLPKGFEWCTIDVSNASELEEMYTLLNENYVEDDDNMFRFDYSKEFLCWALQSPGYFKDWHIGIRQASNKKLLACITGIPVIVRACGNEVKMAEINFLCIHKQLRSKRLAPVLIKEVTRRVNLTDQWSAVYTAGVYLPKPVGKCRYYHRTLNPGKLLDIGFSGLGPRMTRARYCRLHKLDDNISTAGLRPMEERDVKQVCDLLRNYLDRFKMSIHFDEHEVAHWFLPRKDVIYSYVVEDPEKSGVVTDFISFYNLPSTVIGNPKYNHLRAAYSFYNVAKTLPLEKLIADALVFALRENFDVYNCLDLMDNSEIITPLKFGKGDGNLHYYFYNYFIPECESKEVGIVLL